MGRVKGGERERGKGKEGGRQRAEGEGGGESGKQPQVTGDFSVTLAHSTVPPTPLHTPLPSRWQSKELGSPQVNSRASGSCRPSHCPHTPPPPTHLPEEPRHLAALPAAFTGSGGAGHGGLLGRPSSGP